MGLASLTAPDLIFAALPAGGADAALRELAARVSEAGYVRSAEELFGKLHEREQLASTGIGGGVAIPHCRLAGLARGVLAIGICREGLDFRAVDGQPVRVLFLLVSPSEAPAEHLRSLAAVSRWLKGDRHVQQIVQLDDPAAIHRLLDEEEG